MSEMIERVARAMMTVKARLPGRGESGADYPVLSYDPDFDDLPANASEGTRDDEITQEAILKLARAAIEAMREPTEEMMAAIDCGGDKSEWLSGRANKSIYRAMIDGALGERT
jgi:hypothetical protein